MSSLSRSASQRPMKTFHLVSAPFACGLGWLVNILLHLGIRTTYADLLSDHWIPAGSDAGSGEVECGPAAHDHLRWFLPVLHEQRRFRFEPDLELLWAHRLDFALQPGRPTILFVRDPRDAIYSLYRRYHDEAMTFAEYLRRPGEWPPHFPGMFSLPPPETWAYFHLYWLAVGAWEPLHLVRFETMRQDPVAVTEAVLAFLGVGRSREAIHQAIEGSTFERARDAMERTAGETGTTFRVARRGMVGEWREVYGREDLEVFGGPARLAMQVLGYGALGESAEVSRGGRFDVGGAREALPGLQALLAAAREQVASGELREAEERLTSGLLDYAGWGAACLALGGEITALRWTQALAGHQGGSPRALSLFHVLSDLNGRFANWPSVQAVLWQPLEGAASASNIELPDPLHTNDATGAPADSQHGSRSKFLIRDSPFDIGLIPATPG